MKKVYLFFIVIALLIAGFFVYKGITGEVVSASQNDVLAKCLTEKGVTMYGTSWCSFCNKQKEAFGSSFQYIKFVDCDENEEECLAAGVRGYPTWKINGENYPGLRSLEELASLASCSA